jgi:virulence factor Mce-like protein
MSAGRQRNERLESRYRRAALLAALFIVLSTVFVFIKGNLFAGGYQVRADFSSANQLRKGGEVRVAGIKVGEIRGISAGPGNTSIVKMAIASSGRPIHNDATFALKPRLILEGNAYIDVSPGTPDAPELRAGATVPLSQTSVTPQLDQLVDVFDAPTRDALQQSIGQLASGLGHDESQQRTSVAGYQGLRSAVRELDRSVNSMGRVARAARGTQAGDLTRAIGASASATKQLAENPVALADVVTSFNRVTGALADRDAALSASIRGLDQVVRVAPPTLRALDQGLPSLTAFGAALKPSIEAAPTALKKTNRLLAQIAALARRPELPALVARLAPVTAALPTLEHQLETLFGYTTPVTDCLTSHVVPVLDAKIADGPNTTGDPAWLDLLHAFTGFTSASTSFDGNAGTFRAGLAQGANVVNAVIPGIGKLVGQVSPGIQGVRPAWLGYGVEPPFRPDQQCGKQPLPNLNAPAGPVPDWARHPVSLAQRKGRR